jgi:hypothetical protein
VAVTKTFSPEDVAEAAAEGIRVVGESKVQEARQKIPLCPGGLEWHMIGHLQTNKVRECVRLFHMIHGVDSDRLLTAVDQGAGEAGVRMPVCLQVNLAAERSKFGMAPESLGRVLECSRGCANVDVVGLMVVPPFVTDPEDARVWFRGLRELRDEWIGKGFGLRELSMGMSHDFEVAIEEGATLVRIGSALFGERKRAVPRAGLDGTGEE